jgi:hypothetical protein
MEVVKGDSQKADDAAVPDHLWLHAFLMGYKDPQCMARHRAALGIGGGPTGGATEGGAPPPRLAGLHGGLSSVRLTGLAPSHASGVLWLAQE